MSKQTVRFIITIFGDKHIGMLITNIYSILQSNPGSHISVFWQDVKSNLIKSIIKSFETVAFHKTNFDFASDPISRIASKTQIWNYAAQKYPHDYLCFLDVDILVLRRIQHFFEHDFDIVYTYKQEKYPLNTGVILCKGDNYPHFFKTWEEETFKIINDNQLFSKANSPKYPYGAPDQMALFEMIQYKSDQQDYIFTIMGKNLYIKGIPCEVLNQTNSRKITNTTHIIHYKGGWQLILLRGQDFTKHRSKKLSWEMYIKYLETFKKSLEYIKSKAKIQYKPKDLNIIIPFYINTSTFGENKCLYFIYSYYDRVRNRFRKEFSFYANQ